MQTKTFTIRCPQKHNIITIKSNIDDIIITSITTINDDGSSLYISNKKEELVNAISYRYGVSHNPVIFIVIEGDNISGLELETDIEVTVGLAKYIKQGKYTSEVSKIAFNKKIYIHHEIIDEIDSGILCELHLSFLDSKNNTIETCVANVPLNDKRLIVQKADEEFLYSPHNVKLTDGELFIDDDLFTYDTKRVQATFDLSDKYVIYQRADTVNQLSQTVSLDENYNVQCSKQYSYISYAVVIKVLSLDISKLESTPVIKNIAIITTE